MRWILAAFALLAACTASYEDACYECSQSAECPEGSTCTAGICEGPSSCRMTCGASLSGTGDENFSIRFRIKTAAAAPSAVLSQRSSCDATADFWDIQLQANGRLSVELGGAGSYASLASHVPVNDGALHGIIVRRAAGVLRILVDGAPSGVALAPMSLGTLPPLRTASDNPCPAVQALAGLVSDACLWRATPRGL